MSEETLVDKYKRAIQNNKAFAILLSAAFIASSLVGFVVAASSLWKYIAPAPFEKQVENLARDGCILFLPDSATPVTDETIVSAYKDFWRKSDIYYADEIVISGVTYHRGAAEYNIHVGERRAEAARDFIARTARVVPERTQLITRSYGENRPLRRLGEYECGAIVTVSRGGT